jgi:hypothetical protein
MTAGPQGIQGVNGTPGIIPDSSQFLFLDGSRAMTGDLNAPNVCYANGTNCAVPLIAIINNSYQTIANQSQYDLAINETWKNNLTAVNISMKNYVDAHSSTFTLCSNLSMIYPINSVIINTDNVSPATSLGCGSWSSLGTGYALVST